MPRHAQNHVQRGGGQAVRRIGGEHDPLGRHPREQLDDVERKEAGGVIQDAGVLGQASREDPLVADRAVGEDQDRAGVAQGEIDEALGERGQTPAGVDQDGHARGFGEAEHIVHLRPVEHEVLGPGMELDAARTRRQAAFALGQRAFGGIQPAEGGESPFAFAGPADHAIVGQAVGGMALGVVQGEHARPACVGIVEL